MGYKRGYTTDRAQPTVPAARGVAGFKGTTVVAGDAARTYPGRLATVPPDAVTPLKAGADTIPVGGGGGGLTVDNTVDPPAEVTTLVAPGAVIAGDEATIVAVSFRLEETVVAFDDDVATGVPIATLAAGEHVIWAAAHLVSAVTEVAGTVALFVGADQISDVLGLGNVVSASYGGLLPIVLPWRAAGADVVLLKLVSGTWTGGSVRTSVLLGTVV